MTDYSITILQIRGLLAARAEISAALGEIGGQLVFLHEYARTLQKILGVSDDQVREIVDEFVESRFETSAGPLFREIYLESRHSAATEAYCYARLPSIGRTIFAPRTESRSELRQITRDILLSLSYELTEYSHTPPGSEVEMEGETAATEEDWEEATKSVEEEESETAEDSEEEEEEEEEWEEAEVEWDEEEEEEDEQVLKENRYLQARVQTPEGDVVAGDMVMQREADYEAKVFIGARDKKWLGLGTPFKAPQPPDGSPLTLDVLFWEAKASPKAQIAQLELYPQGNSKKVSFPFRTAADQSIFSARIAVFHGNRNLQTGLLRGWVGEGPAALTFVLDAAPLPEFVGLEDRAEPDGSLIVSSDPDRGLETFLYRKPQTPNLETAEEVPLISVDIVAGQEASFEDLEAALGRALGKISNAPDEYSTLNKAGSRSLLTVIAQHGAALYRHLSRHSHMGKKFDDIKYIQIVTAKSDAFFPIEYIYEGEAPEDNAIICNDADSVENAVTALGSGTCCGAYDADPENIICPLKFWSLSKVIERHAHLPEHTNLNGQIQLRNYPVSDRERLLDPLRGAVLAASQEADNVAPDTVKNLNGELNAVLRTKPVPLATDWATWAKKVAEVRPTLLVLLPHHIHTGGFDLLEIGGDERKSGLIREKHVSSPEDNESRQIVLLIGCKTNSAKIALENIVPAFQDAGAEIIVSTIGSILGRHAGPTAAAIVHEIKKQEGNPKATFGDVMLAVRRRLLAEGTPMVLGLTSYGDADWRFGTTDNGGQEGDDHV